MPMYSEQKRALYWNQQVDIIPQIGMQAIARLRTTLTHPMLKYVTAKLGNTESGWNGEGNFTSSSSPGGGGSATFELFDVNDALGVAYWDPVSPGGYTSSTQKRDSILSASGIVSVGTYDDGMYVYPVFDFQDLEAVRDQFAPGLTGRYYSINDTNIVQVKPQASGGS